MTDNQQLVQMLREEFRAGVNELRKEMQTGVNELRSEMQTGVNELRTEMQTGVNELRTEMQTGANELRSEMRAGFEQTNANLSDFRQEVSSKFNGVTELLLSSERNVSRLENRLVLLEDRVNSMDKRQNSA